MPSISVTRLAVTKLSQHPKLALKVLPALHNLEKGSVVVRRSLTNGMAAVVRTVKQQLVSDGGNTSS